MARAKVKGGQKALLTVSGVIPDLKEKPPASITYTREGKAVIKFVMVVQDGSKKNDDGTWTNGISTWFNFEAWPTDKQEDEWMAVLKPGTAVTVFNAVLKSSKDKDDKVWQSWRVDLYNGLFVVEAPATGGSAAGQPSSGKSWAVTDDEE